MDSRLLLVLFSLLLRSFGAMLPLSCKYSFDGWDYDLSPLIQKGNFNWQYGEGWLKYDWNFCANVVGTTDCPSTPAFMEISNTQCIPFGVLSYCEVGPIDPLNPQLGVYVSFWDPATTCYGKKLGLIVNNYCDAAQKYEPYQLKPYDDSDCLSKIDVKTKYACPTRNPEGLSGGSILLITLTVLLFVYIVGGMAFRYRVREARGLDMIPNRDFWFGIPGLVKDGVHFTYIHIRAKVTGQPAMASQYVSMGVE